MSMDKAELKALAKEKLGKKRYIHVKNVAGEARRLAERYGEDPDRAETAAWLHDIVKEESRDELLHRLGQDAIMAGSTQGRPYPVWHGPCAAIYAKYELGVDDEEILDAVGCHTTGRAGMTSLDKILLLADRISAERDFPGLAYYRRLAYEDLDRAVLEVLKKSIEYVREAGGELDEETLRAIEDLRKRAD